MGVQGDSEIKEFTACLTKRDGFDMGKDLPKITIDELTYLDSSNKSDMIRTVPSMSLTTSKVCKALYFIINSNHLLLTVCIRLYTMNIMTLRIQMYTNKGD